MQDVEDVARPGLPASEEEKKVVEEGELFFVETQNMTITL